MVRLSVNIRFYLFIYLTCQAEEEAMYPDSEFLSRSDTIPKRVGLVAI